MPEDPKNPDSSKARSEEEPVEYQIPDPESYMELEDKLAKLQSEFDDVQQRYLRTLADYQNSQRRAVQNEQEAKVQARSGVVQSLLSVVDHFDLALAQDPSKATAESVISGVKLIRDELMKVLQSQGVGLISPQPGDVFDPHRHEAIMHQAQEGIQSGHTVATFQVGFTITTGTGERVIRPAKVSVAP